MWFDLNSKTKEIKVVNKDEIGIDENLIGFKGSPTYVAKSFPPHFERKSILINDTKEILNIIRDISKGGK